MKDRNLSNLGVIKELLKNHGLFLTKSLGQNFLINPYICPRIAELGGAKDSFVLEIGAGIGVLTKELSKLAKKVCAVEIDKRLIPILNDTLSEFDNIEIINEDILNLDLEKLLEEKANGMNIKVCANLPYYITSPILMHILESKLPIESITVMVQKEAAKRMCAKPGTRDCGSISLAVSYYSTPKLLFNVSSGSFYPRPNVDSAVIKLDINKVKPVNVYSEEDFFELIKSAFSQRRKVLINPVSKLWNVSKKELKKKLISLDIDPSARAEQLSLKQFADISNSKYELA
ncbi:MAG: 16S rRNA (adenine(1518)-N(6)/adenine(1519)-N(6))-dimethyltransferase RsmA [Oscillospiraceae bacterium]|nr:16S rRNA (adenine(1518)-N(6)/adenine(1519)-N(6))-dimethyltransferase RsmA [Oscillospiraceae bacterium]